MKQESKKTAIITGSSRGIGKETAIILAKNKAVNVVVCSRTEREINSVVEGIKKLTGNSSVLGIKCDVSIYLQLDFVQTQDLPNQTESSYIQSII